LVAVANRALVREHLAALKKSFNRSTTMRTAAVIDLTIAHGPVSHMDIVLASYWVRIGGPEICSVTSCP
jgi:hypothetical protein